MPRRRDIESICLIGSGPIVIGQACEFDYAGCQALKVLREDGFRTIVVNSNPGDDHDRPRLRRPHVSRAARSRRRRGRARARAPRRPAADDGRTDGAQPRTRACERGRARGAWRRADRRAAGRDRARRGPGGVPRGRAHRRAQGAELADRHRRRRSSAGLATPAVVRPAFTLGGHGGGFVETVEQLHRQVERGLAESPIGQVLVEESVRGWDEFELEVVRDRNDNVVIVCSIENIDPMGVHTGDSVTVAPQMTLSDHAYQELRDAAIAVIRAVGVECGGSNIQFARERDTGELRVIEMNPRVSRSSALASKATGYPIAKVAAKLAVGYTLDEIPERPHRHDARELRADTRLRRRQVPALRVREVPGRRHDARDADEVRRRGDGDRPDVRRGVSQGRALARARRRRAVGAAGKRASLVPRRACTRAGLARPRCRGCRRLPALQARRPCRRRHRPRGGRAREAAQLRRAACLPARRLLRGRGGGSVDLLLLHLRRGRRGAACRARSRVSSSSAPGRTGSGRASSSTTAACTPRRASARSATRP